MEEPPIQHTMPEKPSGSKVEIPNSPKNIGVFAVVLSLLAVVVFVITYEFSPGTIPARAGVAAVLGAQNAFSNVSITGNAAIVVDLTNGKILFEKNPDVQLPLASLTKVPLALVVSEVLPPDAVVTIPRDTSPVGSQERIARGERWRVKNVIDFTLVASSNMGAEILAQLADEPLRVRYPDAPPGNAALWRMNELARELGLSHTFFLNPSGLDESSTLSGAYGSARDVAKLYAYAASSYLSIFSGTPEDTLQLGPVNGARRTFAVNTNEALSDIPGLVMGKTGITDLAGGNLAVVFDAGLTHPVAAVVLGSTRDGRFDDMRLLVEKTRLTIARGE